ncbi:hypothetical protein BCR35DRAFT_299098 [Leucosporidium creatinivorum]|uniref:Ubiquitin carboxyl-terminal hydrolase n=1 Tax=Leucosporidium creatinivorum TaxID=106004 RepID=A0A1Y2G5J2_9BASI|nr:hypothetical protein BCR35DRAFT_299098 [Leucosporidium creatinivorum]
MAAPRWLPLESNPQSFNAWSQDLGLDTSSYSFQDCYGLDPEVLSWVKQPVKAVLLLFPITEAYEKQRKAQDEQILEDGVEGVADVIYFKQTIGNACGTFALLHALANCGVPLADGPLKKMFEDCIDKTPLERAALISNNQDLERVHTETAQSGQTATPDLDVEVDLHFVTFIEHNGALIELDGRRNSPVNHGNIKEGLLEDAAEVVKQIISLSDSIQFNVVTLSPTPEDD